MMSNLLPYFIYLVTLLFVITLFLPQQKEKILSGFSVASLSLINISVLGFIAYWWYCGAMVLNIKEFVLLKVKGYEFFIDLYFDEITAVYAATGAFLTFLVTVYSKSYLHRETGYKRFYSTLMFFFLGYNIVILSGNFETMFIGWEILGISSFLLIAFYNDRYLPVRNALKVFVVYRIADMMLLLAIWLSHHLWHENITFLKLYNYDLVHHQLENHTFVGVAISLLILVAALIKSSQFPFSSWLPRAMEGPTPSSAIFYGSLSVHIGAFVLMRTFHFWEHQISIRILIVVIGLLSSFIATGIARVQSSIKSQIAYASIAQIGLMFVEIALGLEWLALIHFVGNALLRTYQLLVSPSIVSYLIKDQMYHYKPHVHETKYALIRKLKYSFYVLCVQEFNLDHLMYLTIWKPLNKIGKWVSVFSFKTNILLQSIVYVIGITILMSENILPNSLYHAMPYVFSFVGLLMVIKANYEHKNIFKSWFLIITNHFWMVLAISFNEHFSYNHSLLYLSGIVFSGLVGFVILYVLKQSEPSLSLNDYQGHQYEYPRYAFIFLLACLGMMGFPITPTFIGEDLIFSHMHENQIGLALIISLAFIVDGLAIVRVYARAFLGPHVKTYHESAYKSS